MAAETMSTDQQMTRFLDLVVKTPGLEAMWLNTLSLLEHIGSCKIKSAVGDRHDRTDVLDHAADEARHAIALKRHAALIKDSDDYLNKDEALKYFSRLDHESNQWIDEQLGQSSTWRAYLVTTALIEQRALRLYPAYQQRTTHTSLQRELKRLVGEEMKHRLQIEEAAKDQVSSISQGWEKLLEREDRLFAQFITAMTQALEANEASVSAQVPA